MSPLKPFQITAASDDGCRTATRVLAASAMVLADKWAKHGCKDVRVTDPDGKSRDRQRFRETLSHRQMLKRKAAGP